MLEVCPRAESGVEFKHCAPSADVPGMERIAVISDVHGNGPALTAALEQIERAGIGRIWCLGDTIDVLDDEGLACLDEVERVCEVVLKGNHEEEFAPDSPRFARMPIEHVTPDGRIGLWHGSPRRPLHEYVFHDEQATGSLEYAITRHPSIKLVLVGHTHVPSLFARGLTMHDWNDPAPADLEMPVFEPMLACPGSVGQAHDDGMAQWLELGVGESIDLTFRAVRYREPLAPVSFTI
jgi:predicted phosphodiesterase